MEVFLKVKFLTIFSFIFSISTLFCCVLPMVLATFAGGAAVVSLISVFPWLIALSKIKHWIFILTAGLLVFVVPYVFFPKSQWVCKLNHGKGCETFGLISKLMISVSVIMFTLSFVLSYLWVPFSHLLE